MSLQYLLNGSLHVSMKTIETCLLFSCWIVLIDWLIDGVILNDSCMLLPVLPALHQLVHTRLLPLRPQKDPKWICKGSPRP